MRTSLRPLALLTAAALTLAACNTVEGVGQDIQGAGQSIEKAADKSE